MNIIYLSLGSNLGNKKVNLENAEKFISQHIGDIEKKSSLYFSKAQGFTSEHDFINEVIAVSSTLSPIEVLRQIKKIEKEMGRVKIENATNYVDRLIDIDILYFNEEKIESDDLTIPHPKLNEREFVLYPLKELFFKSKKEHVK